MFSAARAILVLLIGIVTAEAVISFGMVLLGCVVVSEQLVPLVSERHKTGRVLGIVLLFFDWICRVWVSLMGRLNLTGGASQGFESTDANEALL